MKLFRPCVVEDLSFRTQLAAKMVALDMALMRAADSSRRPVFRQRLRASIRRLRDEIQR